MSKQINLDDKLLFQPSTRLGISTQTVDKTKSQVKTAIEAVNTSLKKDEYGFVQILDEVLVVDEILAAKQKLDWVEYLVVIGIGGSDLGTRVIIEAFGWNSKVEVIFHGDSPDPEALTRLFSKIDLNKTLFNVVSKSGTTLEIISQYIYLKKHLQENVENWQDHFLFTTDAKTGLLRTEADTNNIQTLSVPENVGGRFSVLTAVGLFPAAMAGIDIKQMLRGGQNFMKDNLELSQRLATTQYQLFTQGLPLVSIMPYSIRLEEFGRWFRQLWAESLGKDETGILPLQARGPADQHSQVQFYNQGNPLLSVLFILIDQPDLDYQIDEVDIEEVSYLRGHSFHQILNFEQEATALALKKAGRPSATIQVDKLTPETLGGLFLLFEMSVVYLAEMFGINAFNQPGVEDGKKLTYAMMGRKEYADLLAEIKN